MNGVVEIALKVAVLITLVVCEATAAIAMQTTTISAVTAGPAAATLNSSPGEFESRESLATPPKSQRSIPEVEIPSRRAASAWPSSCSSSEMKKSSVAAIAMPNESVFEEPIRMSLK